MTKARITSKGQITIPKEVRERLGVHPGDALEFRDEGGRLEIRAVRRRRLEEFRGLFRLGQAMPFEQERAQAWAAQARRLTNSRKRRRG